MRWAVLGTGQIAHDFTIAMLAAPKEQIVAVASRALERSKEFAEKHNVPKAYGSYDEALEDPEVDIVYVAAATSCHVQLACAALGKKKPVLVEKPAGVNAREVRQLLETAQKNDTFLMEGVWMHFFPVVRALSDAMKRGDIGDITSVHASFGWMNPVDVNPGVEDVTQGGGGLLAVGIYLIHLAMLAFNGAKPEKVEAVGELGPKGGDVRTSMVLGWSGGRQAMLAVSLRDNYAGSAVIYGTKAKISIPFPFLCPTSATVEPYDPKEMPTSISESLPCAEETTNAAGELISNKFNLINSAGLAYEANRVAADVSQGKKENEHVSHELSLAVIEVMDKVREKIGLCYPADKY